jgi:hypothetical protein
MGREDLVRGAVLASICLGVLVYNWNYLAWPMHRTMALLVMATVFSFALFYELTMRDAPMEWVLAGILGIMGIAVTLWAALTLFTHPLPNDSTPLVPAREELDARSCTAPPGALTVAVGQDRIISRGKGAFVPFKVGGCSGPVFRVTPRGLMLDDFGYDGDGSVIFKIRHNLFERLLGDYLHVHRPDPSTLGVYDRWEHEIFFVRYLDPSEIRVRGRFLCGDYPLVTIKEASVTVGPARFSRPSCLLDQQRRY